MLHRQIYTCLFFLILIPLSSKALPLPSPAGGGMLRLDETHDFVATTKAWFPNETDDSQAGLIVLLPNLWHNRLGFHCTTAITGVKGKASPTDVLPHC